MLWDTVRRFVEDRILPEVAQWWEEARFPTDIAKEMAALGLFGMHLEGYGCAGTSNVAYGLACMELERETRECGRSCPCKAAWRCFRSGGSALRSRRRLGSLKWRLGT